MKNHKLPVTHAGIIFKKRMLDRHGISVTKAAEHLHMSRKQVSEFVNGKSRVSVTLAKKLHKATNISAEFWLNIQKAYDLHMAHNEEVEAKPLFDF